MAHVLQLIDSLALGGLERVAVNLANGLATDVTHEDGSPAHGASTSTSSLCATRGGGPLEREVSNAVSLKILTRRSAWDWGAARRCAHWAAGTGAEIIHAHGSSLWFGNLLLLAWPRTSSRPHLIWHDHFGRYQIESRNRWLYRILTARAGQVVSVNEMLRAWAINDLGKPADQCHYVPNSIDLSRYPIDLQDSPTAPPENSAPRPLTVVCLANLRQQKNHTLLIEAFAEACRQQPVQPLELQLIGSAPEPGVKDRLKRRVAELGLEDRILFLGERTDGPKLLRAADIGVLSSLSEGLPLALLEYGAAALPVVATAVGQIPDVIQDDSMGLLVESGSVSDLASALVHLATDAAERHRLGSRLRQRVEDDFSQAATLDRMTAIYASLM